MRTLANEKVDEVNWVFPVIRWFLAVSKPHFGKLPHFADQGFMLANFRSQILHMKSLV